MEKTKMLPGRIMVLLVCLGAILGFVGIYEPFSQWAQAGANVPLLGFGNNLWKGVKEMVDKKGFIGIFLGGFKNCAAGLSAALVFSYIASLLCQPKMKSTSKSGKFCCIINGNFAHTSSVDQIKGDMCDEKIKSSDDGRNACSRDLSVCGLWYSK